MKKNIILVLATAIICIIGTAYATTQIAASGVVYTRQDGTDTTVNIVLDDIYDKVTNQMSTLQNQVNRLNTTTHFANDFLTSTYYATYVPGSTAGYLRAGTNATISNNNIILNSNGIEYGPYKAFNAGCYFILYNGENLDIDNIGFDFYGDSNIYYPTSLVKNNHYAYYYLRLTSNISSGELRLFNNSSSTIKVKSIIVFSNATCPTQ